MSIQRLVYGLKCTLSQILFIKFMSFSIFQATVAENDDKTDNQTR